MCAFSLAATKSCCSNKRKSLGPSTPIAYATSVTPPNEAVAWPGADFPIPIPILSSTKSGFLCFFGLRDPHFQAFRAQNRGFCALLRSGTPVFGRFEHRNGIFVSETAIFPWFWLFPSTKSRFLCFFALRNPHFRASRAQNRHFCAQEEGKVGSESVTAETLTTLPPHLRRRTSVPTPADQHQQRPPSNGTRRRQVPSSTVLAPCSAVHAPSSAIWCRVMPSSTVWHRLGTM